MSFWCLELVPVAYANDIVSWKNTSELAWHFSLPVSPGWALYVLSLCLNVYHNSVILLNTLNYLINFILNQYHALMFLFVFTML